jgi:hypothetical protein
LDTQPHFSSTYHRQTDGQTERVNQILEDMLRACALQYGRSWDETGEQKVFGSDVLHEAEKQVHMVRENLQVV